MKEILENIGECLVVVGKEDKWVWKDKDIQVYTIKFWVQELV